MGGLGRVERDPKRADGFVLRTQSGISLQIAAAAPLWMVRLACKGCSLGVHNGLPGLLRSLRQDLGCRPLLAA